MSIRFILGRSGSGKTHYCLTSIRSRLEKDPVDGPPLLLLVPEQASFQAERAIVEPLSSGGVGGSVSGSHRAEVLSFQRLAFRILDSVGAPPRTTLTDTARTMVLRHLIAQNASQLQYYRRVERIGGWIDRISVTIAELIQEAVEPDALEIVAVAGGGDDPSTRAKLQDLRVIYQAYLAYLGDQRVDPSQYLAVARTHLPRCAWLVGAHLWVDGFASMSEQEVLTLVALAERCAEVEITFLVEPSVVVRSPGTQGDGGAARRLFSRIEQTCETLRSRFEQAGLSVKEPVALNPKVMHRFRGCPELAAIERRIFGRSDPDAMSDAGGGNNVEMVELPSRRVEVDYAVSRVCEWVSGSGAHLRYRDIALIVRDLDPYHDLISDALTAHDIPFFIDRRQPLSHHPIVELVRSLVGVAVRGLTLDAVRMLLKTDLLPIDRDQADELENYLIAYGFSGIESWRVGDWTKPMPDVRPPRGDGGVESTCLRLERVNATRRAVLAALDPWLGVCEKGGALRGGQWASAIRAALIRIGAGTTLSRWVQDAEGMGELLESQEHQQVWRDLSRFLDDLAFAFDEQTLDVQELEGALESGLSVLTAGLVPPSIDQVLVGSIERSRHPDIKAAIVLGFNDGVFPARLVEDSILNDDDRRVLRDGGLAVAAPTCERVLEESLLVYIAMTRASDRLCVTYATTDEAGKTMRASPYVDVLNESLDSLEVRRVSDPTRSRQTWDIQCVGDLRRRLGEEFRSRDDWAGRGVDQGQVRARWNAIYDRCRTGLADDPMARIAIASLISAREATLSDTMAGKLHRNPLRTSVSQLETYASCPFKHFAKYALGLRPRSEAALEVTDVGTVHHAILQHVIEEMESQGTSLADWSEDQLAGATALACERVVEHGGLDEVSDFARDRYVLRRSADRIARVMRLQRRALKGGCATPRSAELAYGFDDADGLPSLTIETPKGRRVLLRGYIDRVDIAEIGDELLGIVIDYKRTRDKRLDLSEVYHGLSLQLPAYLLALAEAKRTPAGRPIRPIGAFYVSLATKYEAIGHPSQAKESDAQRRSGLSKPRGLFRIGDLGILDTSLVKGSSEHYNVFIKKDGKLGRRDSSDAVESEEFRGMLEHTRRELGRLADALLDGCIAVAPYRLGDKGPCDWCEMGGVCRHEYVTSRTRFLEKLKRTDVLDKLTKESR